DPRIPAARAPAAAAGRLGEGLEIGERAVEDVEIDVARDAGHMAVVGRLPELPPAPRRGHGRTARLPVGDPEGVLGELFTCAEPDPEARSGVDHRRAAEG